MMVNGQLYPGTELLTFRSELEELVPDACRQCTFPASMINRTIAELHKIKEADERARVMAEKRLLADMLFANISYDSCAGPKPAYFAPLEMFPEPHNLTCQNQAMAMRWDQPEQI